MLKLVKPDVAYFERYNEMMEEWILDGSRIAPWFLDKPCKDLKEFYDLIRKLDNVEKGNVERCFPASSSFFVIEESGKLIGAARLAHYLTEEGLNTWGHIGYGVRPSERRKGYATEILRMTLEEGRNKYHIQEFLVGCYEDNIGSLKTIEKAGGVYTDTVTESGTGKKIRQCRFR